MKPLISVILPIYGVESYLCKCLDSVLAQTYKNLEIILVDDGSPDNCGAICDEYARLDSRVKVIHKENGGLSSARNSGLDIANGAYIGFVDPDDWIANDMFEYLYEGLVGYGADLSYCGYINVHDTWLDFQMAQEDRVLCSEILLSELFWDNLMNFAWNKLYKVDLWRNVRFPVGRNFEDILIMNEVFEKTRCAVILREPKYYYRIRSDGITNSPGFLNRLSIYGATIDRYCAVGSRLPQYREALIRNIQNWYMHELCYEVINCPERREANMRLLSVMAAFIESCKDEMMERLHLDEWEQKKWEAFSEGSVSGCQKSLHYHRKREKIRNRKDRVRKILRLW